MGGSREWIKGEWVKGMESALEWVVFVWASSGGPCGPPLLVGVAVFVAGQPPGFQYSPISAWVYLWCV